MGSYSLEQALEATGWRPGWGLGGTANSASGPASAGVGTEGFHRGTAMGAAVPPGPRGQHGEGDRGKDRWRARGAGLAGMGRPGSSRGKGTRPGLTARERRSAALHWAGLLAPGARQRKRGEGAACPGPPPPPPPPRPALARRFPEPLYLWRPAGAAPRRGVKPLPVPRVPPGVARLRRGAAAGGRPGR